MLSEAQAAAFDTDFHTLRELEAKTAILAAHFGTRPVAMLDVGGGNGAFSDAVLTRFPAWTSTVVDVSDHLLQRNAPNPRKRLVKASVFDLERTFPDERFDLVAVNWLLHHLVGRTWRQSLGNIDRALRACTALLAPDGLLCVGENRYEGPFGSNLSAWLIFRLTKVRTPLVARFVARHANTAGVGVCFQAERGWERLFARAGLVERYPRFHNHPFDIRGLKRAALFLRTAGKVHFYLVPASAGPGAASAGPVDARGA